MNIMTEVFKKTEVEILQVTQQNVEELISIWRQIFGPEDCEENLHKLVHHARNFYTDLIKESLEKQKSIENEINYLQQEAENLRRLLKIDVQLPTFNHQNGTPLLSIQMEMDKSLCELRITLRKRREEIAQLLLEQKELCDELGESMKPLKIDPLPTESELNDFRAHLQELADLRAERVSDLSTLRSEIKNFLEILDINVSTDTEHRLLNDSNVKLHIDTFDSLRNMHKMYGEQVQELRTRLENIRKQLENLWQRLDIPQEKRDKYRKYDGYHQQIHDVLSQELQRCEALKRQNIKKFVEQLRLELQQWWDKTLKSETERKRFTHFNNNCYTDDLLILHEMELEDLKQFYEANHQIFELYAERQLLWDRMTALEEKAHDPARYNNRGGQLLREEKERKILASKLPKIEKKISDLVSAFEESQHTQFLIYGENILELMAKQWEQKRQEREQQTTARKQKTPLSKAGTSMARTPMSSAKNMSSMGRSILRNTRMTPSQTIVRTTVSTQKRRLNDREKLVPNAKRSLKHALESPTALLRLPTPVMDVSSNASSAMSTLTNLRNRTQFKSPLKKKPIRVLATTINRRSHGRYSGGSVGSATRLNKKNSRLEKKGKGILTPAKAVPQIQVVECSDEDDAYDTFEKCIEVRSSIIETVKTKSSDHHPRRLVLMPSIKSANEYTLSTTNHPVPRIIPHSPKSCRKLTTKNLPIII